jgi:hypothetical protein
MIFRRQAGEIPMGLGHTKLWGWIIATLVCAAAATAIAEPPDRPEGRRGESRSNAPSAGSAAVSPVVSALDTNHDGVISSEERSQASTSLENLDKNNDGTLTEDEYRPQGPSRPVADGRSAGRIGGNNARPAFEEREQPSRGDRDRNGAGSDRRGGGPPSAGANPGRMFLHAMAFDADGDGKLSQEELKDFIDDFHKHRPGQANGGQRPSAGRDDDGERPQRPRRPE